MSDLQYFAVEPLIVQNINDNVDGLVEVDTPFDIDAMLDNSNNAPAVSVIWYGERFSEQVGRSGPAKVLQYDQWLIVLKVRDAAAQSSTTQTIRELADPYLTQIHDCMKNFNPRVDGYTQFKKTTCPVTHGSDAGFAYFPFMFEILRKL